MVGETTLADTTNTYTIGVSTFDPLTIAEFTFDPACLYDFTYEAFLFSKDAE